MKSIELQLAEANETIKRLEAENKNLKESADNATKAAVATQIESILKESKLPEVAVTRLKTQFSGAMKIEGVNEAVAAEVEYVKSLNPTPKKNNGAADNGTQSEADLAKSKANLKESFKAMGLSEAEAEIASKE